ncbi:tetratricopeptide repeat protein [Nocardia brasiliensis]|uniref:tetratricopeptide repeat protein n=1 Tax=Nocardia brasiliensis TaxID=37326 RepID=UPI0024582DD2|nr:tetratricopeptide repeat protein [Nocardia brasiliensis]
MGGRLALVVGSECKALGELGFPLQLASDLHSRLTTLGEWESARSSDGPLLNPTTLELIAEVKAAFALAAQRQAALLVSFIGHGMATGGGNFFLLAHDSPLHPESDTAFHIVQVISEQLDRHAVDGLIVLIDACETQQSLTGAARHLTDRVELSARRIELLVATGDDAAYGGCFTRTTLSVFDRGLPLRGENLLPADLLDPLELECTRQVPGHLGVAHGGDPGLWLVPNAARRNDAVWGRPTAGFVDQLTNGLVITETMRRRLAEIVNDSSSRLRGVVGPAGCGKSTLMSLLIRPTSLARSKFTSEYIAAAAFVSAASSIESLARELHDQMRRRVDGFAAVAAAIEAAGADNEAADVFDLLVLEPLARIESDWEPVNLVIDGIDQAEFGVRQLIVSAIADLVGRPELEHVKLIVGIRSGTGIDELPPFVGMHRVELCPPTAEDIARSIAMYQRRSDPLREQRLAELLQQTDAGGWLLARLLNEISDDRVLDGVTEGGLAVLLEERIRCALGPGAPAPVSATAAVLAVLAAAGSGPILPVELLRDALAALGHEVSVRGIRDIVVELGVLVSRGNSGTGHEMLGLSHQDFVDATQQEAARLGVRAIDAHRAISAAILTASGDSAADYARAAGVRHHLACGNAEAAVQLLAASETVRATDNRDMWAAWLPLFVETLGSVHPDCRTARFHLAHWQGETGDWPAAVAGFESLLTDGLASVGPDDAEILLIRGCLAHWRGSGGDADEAVREFERLLADCARVLGADHPDTLDIRDDLADWRGESGDVAAAVAEYEQLLVDSLRILGPDDLDTLATRRNLSYWQGVSGDRVGAIQGLEAVLADCLRVFGPDSTLTLNTRQNLANLRARDGHLEEAIREFESLVDDLPRLIGPDHLDTLAARGNLAAWRGESGDLAGAVSGYAALFTDRLRVQGPDHSDTLRARHNLAVWRGRSGDVAAAVVGFSELLVDRLRLLGPDHVDVAATNDQLIFWQSKQTSS